MSYVRLIRLSALSAMVAGAVTILFNLANIAGLNSPAIDNPRAMLTLLLTIFGFIGIYAWQHERAGILGLAGFVLAVSTLIFNIAFRYVSTFIVPTLMQYADAATAVASGSINTFIMAIFWLFLLGYILFGVATARARVLPAWAGWLLAAGAIVNFVGVMVPVVSQAGSILTGIAIAWLGYALWAGQVQERVTAVSQPVMEI